MILKMSRSSRFAEGCLKRSDLQPVLYSIDEIRNMSFDLVVEEHREIEPVLYTEKMTPLYFGYLKKDPTKKGKSAYRVLKESHAISFYGPQNAPQGS